MNPRKQLNGAGADDDETLDYGSMSMGQGRAFTLGKESDSIRVAAAAWLPRASAGRGRYGW